MLDGSPKLIAIDEQPNHQVVHMLCLRKADRPAYQPLDPRAQVDVLALDLLGVCLPTVGHYASYCRCVDSTKLSNGKRKGTGNVKNGNPYLAWAYMEAVQFALRFQPAAQRFYQRKLAKSRNNTILARKAVAHKLARACYDMMRDLVPYEATKAFG
jgi:hypothetical protein